MAQSKKHYKVDVYIYGDKWWEKCLRKTINYDTFFEYCEANKGENYLDTFVMAEFLDMDMPKHSSYDFHQLMIRLYREKVEGIRIDINLFGKSHDEFLDACIRFIMDDDGESGRENYADWLNKRGESKWQNWSVALYVDVCQNWKRRHIIPQTRK